jgi:hypothetical protein
MTIERIPTKQGHPVPNSSQPAKGPFPPEIFMRPEVVHDYHRPGQDDILEGATAQNNFSPPKVYKCRDCEALVMEYELSTHQCGMEEEDGSDA